MSLLVRYGDWMVYEYGTNEKGEAARGLTFNLRNVVRTYHRINEDGNPETTAFSAENRAIATLMHVTLQDWIESLNNSVPEDDFWEMREMDRQGPLSLAPEQPLPAAVQPDADKPVGEPVE